MYRYDVWYGWYLLTTEFSCYSAGQKALDQALVACQQGLELGARGVTVPTVYLGAKVSLLL